jgi:shikimate dehydrogenase
MHNAAFRTLALDATYSALDVTESEFAATIETLRGPQWRGANITIPHKRLAHASVDAHDVHALRSGSVNTIVNANGRLVGHDTDGPGLLSALRSRQGFLPEGAQCVVLGAGGAAIAAVSALASASAGSITVLARRPDHAQTLPGILGAGARVGTLGDSADWPKDVDLVVHATPVGMGSIAGTDAFKEATDTCEGWLPRGLPQSTLCLDLIYTPRETAFLAAASAHGARLEDGLEMLVEQAALAFALWTGQEAPVDVMREAAIEALRTPR